jgi:methylglutaconyl-CoA hydratase
MMLGRLLSSAPRRCGAVGGCRALSSLPANPSELRIEKLTGDHQGIMVVTLSRPAARNAFGRNMVAGLSGLLERLRDDRATRVVVINSDVDKVFCAGADLKERLTMQEHEVGPFVEGLRRMFTSLEKLPMPTIAAIEGAALGGGLELALACDLRVAGAGATLGLPETSLAIIPGAGGTQRLPRLIGLARAKELVFTATRVDAARAAALGLVCHAVPAGGATAKALEIARAISANGPLAVRLAKSAMAAGMQADLATGMDIERGCYAQVITTQDRTEGLNAFREKRKPAYKGE